MKKILTEAKILKYNKEKRNQRSKKMKENAKILARVERERERESCSLKTIAVLACINDKISLLESKLHIVYRRLKVDVQLKRRKTA